MEEFTAKVKRNYKDSLFRLIFGGEDKSWTLSLYNAVNGSDYRNPEDITITTIEDALYLNMKNDVSFLIADTMNLYEAQSTFNPNMPLRMLIYAGIVYSSFIDVQNIRIYGSMPQKIPSPKLVVFYNGERQQEDRKVLRLSDSFSKNMKGDIEVEVNMLNINFGRNGELLERCRPLCDYSIFVSGVRKYKADGKTMETAVHLAIRDLSDDSPIKKYLLSMEAEVVFSCIFEYDEQKVMNQFREEGREEGRSEERIETAKRMIRNGKLSLTEIAECSGLTTEEVQKLAAEN